MQILQDLFAMSMAASVAPGPRSALALPVWHVDDLDASAGSSCSPDDMAPEDVAPGGCEWIQHALAGALLLLNSKFAVYVRVLTGWPVGLAPLHALLHTAPAPAPARHVTTGMQVVQAVVRACAGMRPERSPAPRGYLHARAWVGAHLVHVLPYIAVHATGRSEVHELANAAVDSVEKFAIAVGLEGSLP